MADLSIVDSQPLPEEQLSIVDSQPLPGDKKTTQPSSFWDEAVENPAKQVASGYFNAAAGGAHLLSNMATGIGKLTHTTPGGAFKNAEDYYTQKANEYAGGRTDFPSKVYRGIGAAPGEIAKYTLASELAGPTAGMAVADALSAADQGPTEAVKAGVKGALTGGALRVMAPASTAARVAGGATAMGGQTALSGGNLSDVTAAALTGGAMGAGAGNTQEQALYQRAKAQEAASKPPKQATISPKTHPVETMVQALRPRSTQLNFSQSLERAMPELHAAQGKAGPITDVDSLIDNANVAQRDVWDRYTAEKGDNIKVDMTPLAKAIRSSVPTKAAFEDPAVVGRINELADKYDGATFPLDKVEDFLQQTNAELAAYEAKYPNVKSQELRSNPETAMLVRQGEELRKILYGGIDTGGGFGAAAADLKRVYGALSDVKATAMRRKVINDRQAPLNLTQQIAKLDMMRSMAGGALKTGAGIVTGHFGLGARGIADMASAGIEPAVAAWIKEQNSTNGLIRNTFENYTPGPRPKVENWRENVVKPNVFLNPATVPGQASAADMARAIVAANQPYSAEESARTLAASNPPRTAVNPTPAEESAQVLQYAQEPPPAPSQFLPNGPTGKSAAESAEALMQIPQSKQAIESAQLLQNLPPSGQRALPPGLPPTSIQTWNPPAGAPDVEGSRSGDIIRPPKSIAHALARSIIAQAPPEGTPPPVPPGGGTIGPNGQAEAIRQATPGTGQQSTVLEPRAPSNPVGYGAETSIRVPEDPNTIYNARYALRELDDVHPSANPHNFLPNDNYQLVNDRDYLDPRNAKRVLKHEQEFDPAWVTAESPTASDGAPVIDKNGNVLGGNNRAMTIARVYRNKPESVKAYRQALMERAQQLGLDPNQIAAMRNPVLTRELTGYLDAPASKKAITNFNRDSSSTLTEGEQAISDSKHVSQGALDFINSKLEQQGPEGSLADALRGDNGVQVIQKLIDDGVINESDRNSYINDRNLLTDQGKARISKLMVGRFFKNPSQLDSMAPEVRTKLEKVTPFAAKLTGSKWDLTAPMQEAVQILDEAKQHGIKNIDDMRNQMNIYGEHVAAGYSPEAFEIAKALKGSTPTLLQSFKQYVSDSSYAGKGSNEGTLFGNAPTPQEAFTQAFSPKIAVPIGMMPPPQ